MKYYIYLLFEIFILKTNYSLIALCLFCNVTALILSRDYILKANFIEWITWLFLTVFIISTLTIVLLFPFILYIPGDQSYMEKILKNSKIPHAQCLIEYKKKKFKNISSK